MICRQDDHEGNSYYHKYHRPTMTNMGETIKVTPEGRMLRQQGVRWVPVGGGHWDYQPPRSK